MHNTSTVVIDTNRYRTPSNTFIFKNTRIIHKSKIPGLSGDLSPHPVLHTTGTYRGSYNYGHLKPCRTNQMTPATNYVGSSVGLGQEQHTTVVFSCTTTHHHRVLLAHRGEVMFPKQEICPHVSFLYIPKETVSTFHQYYV